MLNHDYGRDSNGAVKSLFPVVSGYHLRNAALEALGQCPELAGAADQRGQAFGDGRVLIDKLGLTPGPMIGELLEAVREAHAAGDIKTAEEALALARKLVESRR